MTSANEGIGVPSRPVIKMRYRSSLVTPHLKRASFPADAKLYGRIGRSLLSVRVEADGPSPCPCWPWHFQHSTFWKSSWPCRMLSMVTGVSGGILIGSPGFSVFHLSEKVLM